MEDGESLQALRVLITLNPKPRLLGCRFQGGRARFGALSFLGPEGSSLVGFRV